MYRKVLLVVALFLSSAFSYSYTAFPPITGAETFAINPVFFADQKNSGGAETFLYYGLTDKLDFCSSILIANGTSNFSAMLRYDFGESKIIGVRANASWVIPQVSITLESDRAYFQGTAASQITYDYAKNPAFYSILCPGLKISSFDFFCEVNPGYYMNESDFANCSVREKGFGLDIVPGIGLSFGSTFFSVAIPIYNVNIKATPTIGAWIYYSI